jgi:hypothetical protein
MEIEIILLFVVMLPINASFVVSRDDSVSDFLSSILFVRMVVCRMVRFRVIFKLSLVSTEVLILMSSSESLFAYGSSSCNLQISKNPAG